MQCNVIGLLSKLRLYAQCHATNGWHGRSDSTGRVYERTQTQSTQTWL